MSDRAKVGNGTNQTGNASCDTDRLDHPLMLGKRWGDRAEQNIETWGNQRHDTLLLALIEEVGEIAMAMEEHNRPTSGEPHPYVRSDDAPAHGRRLISEMANLGVETRRFLESNYEEPAGSDTADGEYKLHGEPKEVEPILDEVEDTAPLCFQLYWALQARKLQPGSERSEEQP